MIFRLWICR